MCRRLCALVTVVVVLDSVLVSMAAAGDPTFLGWWKFDEGSGTVAKDSSGNGYDGTVYDAAWVTGTLGGALEFTGSEYVDVPAESWSTIEMQASVAFWAYGDPDSQPQSNFIFGAFSDPAENTARKMSAHVPWGNGNVYFDTGGPGYDRIQKAADPADYEGTWTHWTFVKNAETGDQQIYLNGELWHSGSGMTQTMDGVTKFTIGTKPSLAEGWYQGMIDDFRLYGRALTAEELPDIMLGKGPGTGLAGTPSPDNEGTDVPRDVPLEWTAGEFAVTHDVYLGTVFDDVNDASRGDPMDVLLSQG
ncbi:MAG: LamG domain-containing protein, partial [Planctomycetota bacterium]